MTKSCKSEQAKAAEQLFRLRFQMSLGKTEGVKKLRELKLDIARIKTIARERELAGDCQSCSCSCSPAKSTRKKAKKD